MASPTSSATKRHENGKVAEDVSRSTGAYTAKDIQVLEGIQAIRLRPAMYIGSTSSSGLVHLLWEALDNAVDEAVAGYGSQITVDVDRDGVVTVQDEGRGMPFDLMTYANKKLPAATVLMTVPHSGGKFAEGAYKTAGGLHGVGATIINAVSEWLELDIWRDGQHFSQRFERGKPKPHTIETSKSKKHGTRLRWRYDRDIFDHDAYYPRELIERRLQAAAHLNRGLALHLTVWDDETDAVVTRTFLSKEGLADFVRQAAPPGAEPLFSKPITFNQLREGVQVEIALQPNRGYKLDLHSFANAVRTPEGGVHERGFKAALTRVANDYAARLGVIKNRDKEAFKAEVIQQGLVAAISVKLKDPQFEGQTKMKLNNAPVEGIVRSVVTEGLKEWFEARPTQARDWLKKIQDDQKLANRLAAEEQIARTGQKRAETVDLDTSKFARASTTDPDRAELFIVEGESAGGCFSGDTHVLLASGQTRTMRDLAADWQRGVHHFGYATNAAGDVRIVPLLEPRLTRHKAPIVEVVLDNEQRLRCTPDHLFRLRDGTYRPASELSAGDSLMPLKRRLTTVSDPRGVGYEQVWMNGRLEWWHTHHLADRHNLQTGVYARHAGPTRHHIDLNKRNNDPRNIVRMGAQAHLDLHASILSEANRARWRKPEYRTQMLSVLRRSAPRQWQDPAYRARKATSARQQWQEPETVRRIQAGFRQRFVTLSPTARSAVLNRLFAQQQAHWSSPISRRVRAEMTRAYFAEHPDAREALRHVATDRWADADRRAEQAARARAPWQQVGRRARHRETLHAWWKANPTHREKIGEARRLECAPTALSYDSLLSNRFAGDLAQMNEAAANANCAVVSVSRLTECVDVYDLTVESYHNFALSAGVFVHNSAKKARDATYQAILALRGKPINVVNARPERLQMNKEYALLASVIGTGVRGAFNLDKCKYEKVILMTDADVDGGHIRALLLALFYQEMPGLIEAGKVFVAMPPLYSMTWKGKTQWLLDDDALRKFYSRNGEAKNVPLKRYKGLGEMDAGELRETTMHPASRVLKRVTLEDSSIASQVVTDLMDESRAEARREFLAEAARRTDLDV